MPARDEGAKALKNGDPKAALQHLAQAIQENPSDPQAHAYIGAAFGQLNMLDKAVEHLRRASELAPQSAAMRFNLGMGLEKAGKQSDAISVYREVVKLDASYERASQALARLGQGAAAVETPPASAPVAATPAPSAPAPVKSVFDDFAIGDSTPQMPVVASEPAAPVFAPNSPLGAPAPPAPPAQSMYGAPPASVYGTPPPPTAYAAPPSAIPPPSGPMPLNAAFEPPAPAASGPPIGLTPMGDWTPPPGTPAPAAPWAPQPSGPPQAHVAPTGAVIADVHAPEADMDPSTRTGNFYLAGMSTGVWWGLIGTLFTFVLPSLILKGETYGKMLPLLFVAGLMYIASGVLMYGFAGVLGGNSDDAEAMCGRIGAAYGVLEALIWLVILPIPLIVWAVVIGCIWVSRQLGRALGTRIAEAKDSVFVVAGAGGVAMTRVAR